MHFVEEAYQEFKNNKDQTKLINGKLYYRIVWSYYIDLKGRKRGTLLVIPSPDMPKNRQTTYMDENGNHFTLAGFHHLRFIDDVPEWYIKCGECGMEWQETKDIGKYLTIVD